MNGLTLIPTGTATGPGWQHRLERDGVFSAWKEWQAEGYFFSVDPITNGDLEPNVTYWLYARHPLLPQSQEVASALQITETNRVVPVSFGADQQLTPAPAPTAGESPIDYLTAGNAARAVSFIDALFTSAEAKARLCAFVGACGLGTGTGAGSLTLSAADIEELARYAYNYAAFLENRSDNAPIVPVLTGAPGSGTPATTAPAVVNSNLSKYEAGSIGLTIQANCSNGEIFYGRVIGKAGSVPPDQEWHLMGRFNGDAALGSYSVVYANLNAGGYLPGGTYTTQVRAGVDDSTIKSLEIVVAAVAPKGTDKYRITGNATPAENAQNEVYDLEQFWTDNTWRVFAGAKTWVLTDFPVGLGVATVNGQGLLSGGDNIISADRSITLRCYIGINIESVLLLKNTNGTGTPPTAPVRKINYFGADYEAFDGGFNYIANATEPVEFIRDIYRVKSDGTQEQFPVVPLQIYALDLVNVAGNAYGAGGATVQRYLGKETLQFAQGTYAIRTYARPVGNDAAENYYFLPDKIFTIGASQVNTPIVYDQAYYTPVSFDLQGPDQIGEATTSADYNVIAIYKDGRTAPYTGAGSFGLATPYPAGVTVATKADVKAAITVPTDSVSANTDVTLRFTLPNGQKAEKKSTILNVDNLPANQTQYVQFRFVPSFFGNNSDLLEIQMKDTFPGSPMSIDVRLSTQAAPSAQSNSYNSFLRSDANGTLIGDGNDTSVLRNYRLASGQNLKSKTFKVYISRNAQTAADLLTLTLTTGTNAIGYTKLYIA